jgi:ribose transport system ATP-binding protein
VARGEVVGIAGLAGAGQQELLEAIFGARRPERGTVRIRGKPLPPGSVPVAVRAGLAYVPEDRAERASFGNLSLCENVFVADSARHWRGGRLRHGAERVDAAGVLGRMLVKAPSLDVPLRTLSGGNQQKVVLGRWIRRTPSVLLLHEPTQGVDVTARAELYEIVRRAVERDGAAVLVASSDLDELVILCDRVIVLAGGRTGGSHDCATLDGPRLNELVYDLTPEER